MFIYEQSTKSCLVDFKITKIDNSEGELYLFYFWEFPLFPLFLILSYKNRGKSGNFFSPPKVKAPSIF